MLTLARVFETEGDRFAELYEPEQPPTVDNDVEELREMFRRLELMEAKEILEPPRCSNPSDGMSGKGQIELPKQQ